MNVFDLTPTALPGCFILSSFHQKDDRGSFTKVFHEDEFKKHKLPYQFKEQYFSTSKKGVLRGLHFQTPPHDHEKLVYCSMGSILDVVLDLRKDEKTFGQVISLRLEAHTPQMIIIPKGCAHGFCTPWEDAMVTYMTTTVYNPEHDRGLLWTSIPFEWPMDSFEVSKRDTLHPTLQAFDSPF